MAINSDTVKPETATRTESFVWGIPQNGLQHKEREVQQDEPPPLPANAELTYIGKPTERYDGPAKAMGKGKYTADVNLPGMLYARLVDATIPHGRIVSIDTSAAEKVPGVRAVHVIEHVYGVAQLRDPKLETPSRYPMVRYAGQPIAGVAAISQQIANDAAALVKVQYDTMPFVVDRSDARSDDAPMVFPGPADAAGSAGGCLYFDADADHPCLMASGHFPRLQRARAAQCYYDPRFDGLGACRLRRYFPDPQVG